MENKTPAARIAHVLRELQTAEAPAVDLLAAVAPWLAPAFPAAYTLANVAFVLLADWGNPWFAVPVGALVALGVEAVGIAAVHTVIGLWGRERSEGLVGLAGAALGMYLLIVVGVNVALDYQAGRPIIIIVAAALLCLMTVTGGIIAGVRARAQRAAADEQAKQDAATEQADAAIAEDSRQFDQEQAAWAAKGEREERMQAAQHAHDERMAKIARGIDPDAQPQQPPQPRNNSRATGRDEDVLRLHAENPTWDNATIARELGMHRATVGRILARTNGNGATK